MIFSFEWDGKRYEFDDEKMSLGEARWIKQETGLFSMKFFDAVKDLDPDAIACLVVLGLRRGGMDDATLEKIGEEENGYFNFMMHVKVDGESPVKAFEVTSEPNRATRRKTVKKP